jgi:hypothetical protein
MGRERGRRSSLVRHRALVTVANWRNKLRPGRPGTHRAPWDSARRRSPDDNASIAVTREGDGKLGTTEPFAVAADPEPIELTTDR